MVEHRAAVGIHFNGGAPGSNSTDGLNYNESRGKITGLCGIKKG